MPRFKSCILPSLMALVLTVSSASPAGAQLVVYDPTNYASNVLQAARALEQVNNQIQSLSNEATWPSTCRSSTSMNWPS